MSPDTWALTGLEFGVALGGLGRDRLPYPLRFRPIADDLDDLTRQRREAARAVAAKADERLFGALTALLEPTVRIEVQGFSGSDLSTAIRIHAGVRGNTGAVAIQQPGSDSDTGADVTIRRGPATSIAQLITDHLPTAPEGTRRGITVHRNDLDADRPREVLTSANHRSAADEADRFFRRERTSMGEITVYSGPAYDSRPTRDGRAFHWIDYTADGRYVVRNGRATISTLPASTSVLVKEIQRLVSAAQSVTV